QTNKIVCLIHTLFQVSPNKDLISLNQDPLGKQAYVVDRQGGAYILVKDIEKENGTVRAVALYNPEDTPRNVVMRFSDIDLGGKVSLRDLMLKKDIGTFTDSVSVSVPAHGVKVYRAKARIRNERRIYEAETAYLTAYQELYNPLAVGTPVMEKDDRCSGSIKISNLGSSPRNDLQWRNVYSRNGGQYIATLDIVSDSEMEFIVRVNNTQGKKIKVGKSNDVQSVNVNVTLNPGNNTVRLVNDRGRMPSIDRMTLRPY
ncbi:MAG: alpha-galactosidase, partial [Prevotellaceae bacterium]|nr:alpha-galactosidase [Prevotellaceae bacterium]MDO4932820.1 alpha-galactosidase [Prevotellaceae bacterium]